MQPPSVCSVWQTDEKETTCSPFINLNSLASHYFKDCAHEQLVYLSFQTRIAYTYLFCICQIYIPEMVFELTHLKGHLLHLNCASAESQTPTTTLLAPLLRQLSILIGSRIPG